MHSHTGITIESFLKEITSLDGTIDLATLKKFGGAGTHDIYRSDKYPGLLLKVMHRTVGKDAVELSEHIQKLDEQCSALYETFGESRCIIEKRSIQSLKSSNSHSPQKAIVSVVPFDTCFESKDKFGFNVCTAELDGRLIESKRYLYKMMNMSLLGDDKKSSPYVMRNYTLLNETFEKIFKLLDTDKDLAVAMREFLTKYKSFYQKTGILLDTIGLDNVLFYKVNDLWQFKLGSVIKHDTGALTKKMLNEINTNPAIVNKSFEAFTSIYFMPACIRALNACAEKVGMGKIIEDIIIDAKTIDILSKMHMQLGKPFQIRNYVEHGEFSAALQLYNKYVPDEKADDTPLRDLMGTLYWETIKKGGKDASLEEVEAYLKILCDERNKFPESRKKIVEEAIEGLKNKISLDSKKVKTDHKKLLPQALKFFDPLDPHTKKEGDSDKQFVARLGRQRAQKNKF